MLLNIPDPATKQGGWIFSLWQGSWIAALDGRRLRARLILLGRRRLPPPRRTGFPMQTRYNIPIEILYTIVPLIIILGAVLLHRA